MKKIVFVMTSLNTGGIATSLVNLLNELKARNDLDIDVVLLHGKAKDAELIPDNISIKAPGRIAELIAISATEARKMGMKYFVLKCLLGALCKLAGHGVVYKIMYRFCESYNGYDYAISCSQSAPIRNMYGGCNEFVLSNIQAKEKIAFIHCDYVTYGINDRYSHGIYTKFDKIAVVSESVGKVFLAEEPQLTSKTYTVKNCHNINRILTSSRKDPVVYDMEELNILTVARMGTEKGHIRALEGLKQLKELGVGYRWHLVGGDVQNAPTIFLEKMKELGLESNVVFHGMQTNPYRYMPNADFLLVPSEHEAAPMVFDEARILHLPIVTTDTISAREMVGNLGIGLVCYNTNESLTEALIYIATHRELLKRYKENTYNIPIDNTIAIKQFMELIGDSL